MATNNPPLPESCRLARACATASAHASGAVLGNLRSSLTHIRRALGVLAFALTTVASAQEPSRQDPQPPAPPTKEEGNPKATWARQLASLPRKHPKAQHTWEEVRVLIARSKKYSGTKLRLDDASVLGLVPIGENPATQLWEFYDLRSAWDGTGSLGEITIPKHRPDGTIEVREDTGIVFVLLPGGSFHMGAQSRSETDPCFDPRALASEGIVIEVALAPFFISRHELTQAQWARLTMGTDVERWPSRVKVGTVVGGKSVTVANPVESVDWTSCNSLLTQHGFVLPTEAQWEYACRAGTSTPWWPGSEPGDLAGKENVRDKTGDGAFSIPGPSFSFEDGHVCSSPCGSFAANAFGLHDVHGNVREWCLDEKASYSDPTQPGTGMLLPKVKSDRHYHRGGSFFSDLPLTRSSYRNWNVPTFKSDWLGVRPARAIRG